MKTEDVVRLRPTLGQLTDMLNSPLASEMLWLHSHCVISPHLSAHSTEAPLDQTYNLGYFKYVN